MLEEILRAADRYTEGQKNVTDRRAAWQTKHKELKEHLKTVADYLNGQSAYKPGYYVDTLHAFNEEINGTCKEMPSVTLRSGDMSMLVTFHNSLGERREYTEEGFRLSFVPAVNGEVVALLTPHQNELNKNPPKMLQIAIISEPGGLTMDMADKIVAKGIEQAFYSSYTGIAEEQNENEQPQQNIPPHNPIGFKRYETTEKVD